MSEAPNTSPKWLIDTRGMHEALTTRKNSIKNAVISAIENGTMLITKNTSKELKELYPDVYDDFKKISGKKYLTPAHKHIAHATVTMQNYGSNILGGIPSFEYFQFFRSAQMEKLACVTAGTSLSNCSKITTKLKLLHAPLSLELFAEQFGDS